MNNPQADKTSTVDSQHAADNESPRMPWAPGEPTENAFTRHNEEDTTPRRRINEGLLLLALVVVVAGGVLWLMRAGGKASIDTSSRAAEAKIEAALAQLAKAANPDVDTDGNPLASLPESSDQVIALFLADPTAKQVKLNQLKNNPFAMIGVQRNTATTPMLSVDPAEQQRRQRVQRLRDELGRLQLQTVMQGRIPMAVISGNVVRQGQSVGSFTVAAIEARSVTLTAEGNTYRLEMAEPLIGNALND